MCKLIPIPRWAAIAIRQPPGAPRPHDFAVLCLPARRKSSLSAAADAASFACACFVLIQPLIPVQQVGETAPRSLRSLQSPSPSPRPHPSVVVRRPHASAVACCHAATLLPQAPCAQPRRPAALMPPVRQLTLHHRDFALPATARSHSRASQRRSHAASTGAARSASHTLAPSRNAPTLRLQLSLHHAVSQVRWPRSHHWHAQHSRRRRCHQLAFQQCAAKLRR